MLTLTVSNLLKRNKSGKTAVVAAGGSSKKEASGPSEPEDASTVSLDDDRPVLCMPAPRRVIDCRAFMSMCMLVMAPGD